MQYVHNYMLFKTNQVYKVLTGLLEREGDNDQKMNGGYVKASNIRKLSVNLVNTEDTVNVKVQDLGG